MTLLRPEARPITWNRLIPSQQDAFERIVDLLNSAVEALPEEKIRSSSNRSMSDRLSLDFQRSNNIVMLSGKRGTGKTSLLLSLRHLLRPSLSLDDRKKLRIPPEWIPVLGELSKRIVWLETLDLEPLPNGTSLLAAILARIEEVIREENGDWSGFDSWVNSDRQSGIEKAISDFDRLANDVAYAWEDGPEIDHHLSVEPEIRARDVRRAENARLSLRRRLDQILHEFSWNVKWRDSVCNPLFVLPIDDFDLNPRRCLELLRLLRGIGSGRLFSLILGDVEVASLALDLKMQGELGRLVKGVRLTEEQSRELGRQGKVLATEAIRKLMPPDQRLYLTSLMTFDETMAFRPAPDEISNTSKSEEQKTLKELLQSATLELLSPGDSLVPGEEDATNLAQLLAVDQVEAGWPENSRYSGSQALRGTVREITDRWMALSRLSKDASSPATIQKLFWHEMVSSLRREDRLPENWRRELNNDLDEIRRFPPFAIESDAKTISTKIQSVNYPPIELDIRCLDRVTLFNAYPNERSIASNRFELIETSLHSFVLVHDLLVRSTNSIDWTNVVPSISQIGLVRIQWRLLAETLKINWPGSIFRLFFDLEKSSAWWNTFASRVSDPEYPFEYASLIPLATAWLLIGFASATRQPEDWKAATDFRNELSSADPTTKSLAKIDSLLHRVEGLQLLDRKKPRRSPVERWVVDAAVLLSPENAIPKSIVEKFANKENETIGMIWKQNEQPICARRRIAREKSSEDIAHLLLNPTSFGERCVTLLDQAPNVVRRSERLTAVRALAATDEDSKNELDFNTLKSSLINLRKRFDNRYSGQTRAHYKKNLAETTELLRRMIASLQRHEAPDHHQPLFREPEISETIQQLTSILDTVNLLKASYELHTDAIHHPINQFGGGMLCPDLKVTDA